MAEGNQAFPSRTRPLSPPAPMVLGPQGPGRVGRCQANRAGLVVFGQQGRFFLSYVHVGTAVSALQPPQSAESAPRTAVSALQLPQSAESAPRTAVSALQPPKSAEIA